VSSAADNARLLAALGIAVAPIGPHGPPLADATTDLALIEHWESYFPSANFVAPTGREFGLLVLDVRETLLRKVEYSIPDLLALQTWRVRRKPGESHIWFSITYAGGNIGAPQFGRFKRKLAPKHLARVPGGLHSRSGLIYNWDVGHSPSDCGLLPLPRAWERTLVRASALPASEAEQHSATAPPEFDPNATASWRYFEMDHGF